MNILEKRKENADLIAKNRFIKTVLAEQGDEMKKAQTKVMNERGFTNPKFFSKRSFNANDNELVLTVLKLHRFVDMKSRKTSQGVIKKKSHPLYNRIVFGHLSNIIRELSFGYSDAVIEEFKKLED